MFDINDGRHKVELDFRAQFRAANPFDGFPGSEEGFDADDTETSINRARIKLGGHLFQPWFKFYFEEDVKGPHLLDARIMIERNPHLKFKIGQWKAHFSQERIISSGKRKQWIVPY